MNPGTTLVSSHCISCHQFACILIWFLISHEQLWEEPEPSLCFGSLTHKMETTIGPPSQGYGENLITLAVIIHESLQRRSEIDSVGETVQTGLPYLSFL